ncbi:MAG: U32 family peptidase [Burkholderiaceae bacterium]|nr:U32 family peptidase [Burkholderiaceae bacterium]
MKLALAPIPGYWPKEAVYEFYEAMATAPVDIVYLGETICARRHALRLEDWLEIGRSLRKAGKEVILSTPVLPESEAQLMAIRHITQNRDFPVEANDMGAVRLLAGRGGFVAGLHLNIYNPAALGLMAGLGAKRWVMPLEMNRQDLAGMMASIPEGVETEVLGYGRLPLAFSARCFTARHYNLPRDDCRFSCMLHPDGLRLRTQEAEDFLVINGVQMQSAKVYCLIRELPVLQEMGVNVLRLVPHSEGMPDIAARYADVLSGHLSPEAGEAALQPFMPAAPCNGYWHGQSGMAYVQPGLS